MTNDVLVTRADYEALIRSRGFTEKQVAFCELPMHLRVLILMRPRGVSRWRKRFRSLRREMQRRSMYQVQLVFRFESKKLVGQYRCAGKMKVVL